MSDRPFFSMVIPTFNSSRTLARTLESIRGQEYDQDQVEILVVDGGSEDDTRQIAERYGCRVLENPRVQQEYAKYIGLTEARGRAVVFIDSDESFESPKALAKRERMFGEYPSYKFLHASGYRKPPGASPTNDYINLFSDPFVYFLSGVSGEAGLLEEGWKKRFDLLEENETFAGFKLSGSEVMPTVDLCAGNTIDLDFVRSEFGDEFESTLIIPQLFYMIAGPGGGIAVLKDDAIVHYSADRMRTYVRKLDWRVKVNIHYRDIPGTGFANREQFQPRWVQWKKYLFMPYALTVVVPLAQAVVVAVRRRRPIALVHPALCIYVALDIIWQYGQKALGRRPPIKTYGSEQKVLDL